MRYIAYSPAWTSDNPENAVVEEEGVMTPKKLYMVPTGGELSVEVSPGVWLNIIASEDANVSISDAPAYPNAPPKPPPTTYLYRCHYCGFEQRREHVTHCKACSWRPMLRPVEGSRQP